MSKFSNHDAKFHFKNPKTETTKLINSQKFPICKPHNYALRKNSTNVLKSNKLIHQKSHLKCKINNHGENSNQNSKTITIELIESQNSSTKTLESQIHASRTHFSQFTKSTISGLISTIMVKNQVWNNNAAVQMFRESSNSHGININTIPQQKYPNPKHYSRALFTF